MGHTLSGEGTGAVGVVKETDKNREVGKRLISMLQEKGHSVVNCTVDRSSSDLAARVRKANAQDLDVFLSIHLNAFNGKAYGVETYSYSTSGTGRAYAQKIQNELVSRIGWTNRGCKTAGYYVLKNTKAPAVLVELGFCDNKGDMDKWHTENIAKGLFKALTGAEYVAPKPPAGGNYKVGDTVTVSKDATHYATGQKMASWVKGSTYTVKDVKSDRVLLADIVSWVFNKDLVGAKEVTFKARITADILNVRKGPGTNNSVSTQVRKGQVFTIVDTDGNWGKLKSGAGWISLDYIDRV